MGAESCTPRGLPSSTPAALRRWGPRAWGPPQSGLGRIYNPSFAVVVNVRKAGKNFCWQTLGFTLRHALDNHR